MNNLKLKVMVFMITILMACERGTSKQPATAEGFGVIEQEIKNEFGDDAYFTDLKIVYAKEVGNVISITVTEAPESLKMGEWILSQNTWKQTTEVTLEVPEGYKAADFMFQLNDKINLTKLGELVEKSIKQLTSEKNLKNLTLSIAFIKFPKNGNLIETQYSVKFEQEKGGASFRFFYTLDGELIKMDS